LPEVKAKRCPTDGNIGDVHAMVVVILYFPNENELTIQSAECPLFINKDGKFVIFSHPSQDNPGLTG
jgi:hypothetical protein